MTNEVTFDPEAIIEHIRSGNNIPEPQLSELLLRVGDLLNSESNVVCLSSPVVICGDIHGQLYDLFELFEAGGDPATTKYLFMGDYVDRGHFSLLTFAYLAVLKVKHPENITLLRGNHESRQVNHMYGFYQECLSSYGHAGVWSLCNEIFDLLPMAALIDERVFSVHGGLSPSISLIESINIPVRTDELPSSGSFSDLCWSDPERTDRWGFNQRGAGYIFGYPQTKAFCHMNRLDLITRSHQMVMEGYEWFFNNSLITVWSAPNYMYRMGNKAAILRYDGGTDPVQSSTLIGFEPCPPERRKIPEETSTNQYFA